jgi:hypothetical protein
MGEISIDSFAHGRTATMVKASVDSLVMPSKAVARYVYFEAFTGQL